MTTAELREYVEREGLERAVERFEYEPLDNQEIRRLHRKAWAAMDACKSAMAELAKALDL